MKITQFLTNLKLWQSSFVALIFLFSFSINAQSVGDDLMANTNGALSTAQAAGSGQGCISGAQSDGVTACGWTAAQGTNYAPGNNSHGQTHSGDRMWKMFAGNSGNGEIVAQEFSQLPLGTYTVTFYHKWTNGGGITAGYANGSAPKLSFKKSDGAGGWITDTNYVLDIPLGNIGANADWTEMTATFEVTEVNDYRMQIYKNGGSSGSPNDMYGSLHLDTFSFVYTAAAATSGCDYTLTLNDQYNDGWTNSDGSANNIDVLVNGVVVSNHTITGGSESFAISASYGDVVSLSYNVAGSGNWAGENSFVVTDADGATVTSGNSSSNGESFECVDPSQVNLAVSATTDGGSATFTFDIANFTVGAAAGEGDGHIHYSLNGGSEVMVYSTDALTLSDLPNGDHTIVFSLVDPNHAPLDPAVEATVEFSTFNGVVACDGSYSYTYGNNEDPANVIFTSVNEGGTVTVTVTGSTENNYDDLVVTNGAGEVLYSASGDHTGQAITSNDGTINVAVDSDSSVSGYTLDFAVTCGAAQTLVTFTVNTENITVGENGMYVGGGVLGNALAYAMTDDDADGTYEVTVSLDTGTTGNYIFLNSPANGDDYGAKEVLDGQECADPNNWNDRILPEITGDAMTIQHCFGSCESDGTCPAAVETHDVTFSVDTANYPGGLADTDQLYVSGNLNGWSGDANPMSDDDGDGIWEVTIALADGDYEYKFTMNNWAVQEEFGAIGAVEGCTVSDGTFVNRSLTVAGEDMVLPTVYWNLCPGESPGEVYNVTFNLDATGIDVGANGMYMGGGILGGANAVAMSDDDGDGIWTVTVEISTDQIGGNYTFLNSPNDGGDWNAKEDISGQDLSLIHI